MNDHEQITSTIITAIDKVLAERLSSFRADDPDYLERVAWVRAQIQRDKDNHEMKSKIISSALAWVLPLFLGFVALSIWHEVVDAIKGAPH